MGKLSILGAKRVEALQTILDQKCKQEINELDSPIPENTEEENQIAINYYEKNKIDIQKVVDEYNHCAKIMKSVDGCTYGVSTTSINELYERNMYKNTPEYKTFLQAKNAIIKKYDDKKNQLWLCETLEEAKQIVGIN